MANARERAKSKRDAQRHFHLSRIHSEMRTKGKEAGLQRAWEFFKAERLKCTDDAAADRIGQEVFQFLLKKADEFPRRSPS